MEDWFYVKNDVTYRLGTNGKYYCTSHLVTVIGYTEEELIAAGFKKFYTSNVHSI